jgi:hypothetical protein
MEVETLSTSVRACSTFHSLYPQYVVQLRGEGDSFLLLPRSLALFLYRSSHSHTLVGVVYH